MRRFGGVFAVLLVINDATLWIWGPEDLFGPRAPGLRGSIAGLLYFNAKLTLMALTIGPLVAWLVTIINKRFRRYSRRIQDSMGDVTRVAKESFEAPRLIKVYNAEQHLGGQFEAVNERNRRSNMRLILTKGLANPIVQLVTAIGAAFVISFAIADAVNVTIEGAALNTGRR